jgi:hypothetical protein
MTSPVTEVWQMVPTHPHCLDSYVGSVPLWGGGGDYIIISDIKALSSRNIGNIVNNDWTYRSDMFQKINEVITWVHTQLSLLHCHSRVLKNGALKTE